MTKTMQPTPIRTVHTLLVLTAAAVAFGPARPALAVEKQVGWVEAVSPDAAGATVTRGGKTTGVSLLMPVLPGDEFRVPGGTLTLVVTGSDPVEVGPAHGAYVVHASAETPDLWSRILDFSMRRVTGKSERPTETVTAIARSALPSSAALRSPLLETRETFVAADAQPFRLSWLGGVPPYEVRVTSDGGGTTDLWASGLSGAQITAADWRLPAGTYTVAITDSKGQKVRYGLDAVDPATLPPEPPEVAGAALPANARDMLYALWLADRDDGRWKLEAYRRLQALGGALPSARQFAAHLETDEAGQ